MPAKRFIIKRDGNNYTLTQSQKAHQQRLPSVAIADVFHPILRDS
jgi:hypothetical protein